MLVLVKYIDVHNSTIEYIKLTPYLGTNSVTFKGNYLIIYQIYAQADD